MRLNNINLIEECCCGCGACYAVCPKDAIYSNRGLRGEPLYKANDLCINCGKCIEICPTRNVYFNKEIKTFYRAIARNRDVLRKSSSGGIAYEMARKTLIEGGIIYAAMWDVGKQAVRHGRIDSLDKLSHMQGSKYIHSKIDKVIYLRIVEDVKKTKVLFIGTPCQVSAVKNLVGNNGNLISIDLVCHGVPSAEMWEKQLKQLKMAPIESISFRRGLEFILDLKDSEGNLYLKKGYDNPYYSLYLSFSSLRESCYSCVYAQRKRVGDLTIGDFVENGKGYSCVLPNSDVGQMHIVRTTFSVEYEERNVELLNENDALNRPTPRNEKIDVFTNRYNKHGLYFAYYRTFYKFAMKRIIRKMVGDKIYYDIVNHLKK